MLLRLDRLKCAGNHASNTMVAGVPASTNTTGPCYKHRAYHAPSEGKLLQVPCEMYGPLVTAHCAGQDPCNHFGREGNLDSDRAIGGCNRGGSVMSSPSSSMVRLPHHRSWACSKSHTPDLEGLPHLQQRAVEKQRRR